MAISFHIPPTISLAITLTLHRSMASLLSTRCCAKSWPIPSGETRSDAPACHRARSKPTWLKFPALRAKLMTTLLQCRLCCLKTLQRLSYTFCRHRHALTWRSWRFVQQANVSEGGKMIKVSSSRVWWEKMREIRFFHSPIQHTHVSSMRRWRCNRKWNGGRKRCRAHVRPNINKSLWLAIKNYTFFRFLSPNLILFVRSLHQQTGKLALNICESAVKTHCVKITFSTMLEFKPRS